MPKDVVTVSPATVPLDPSGMPSDWILSGTPQTRSKNIVRSHDWTSNLVAWDCTAGRFKWHYTQDETIMVVSGEAIMINEKGEERRLGPGDIGFFPAGTSCTWWVPDHIRKVAVVKESLWQPLGLGLKLWNNLMRSAGFSGKSPL
jgi:uncharacterized cupin superfamily protein